MRLKIQINRGISIIYVHKQHLTGYFRSHRGLSHISIQYSTSRYLVIADVRSLYNIRTSGNTFLPTHRPITTSTTQLYTYKWCLIWRKSHPCVRMFMYQRQHDYVKYQQNEHTQCTCMI